MSVSTRVEEHLAATHARTLLVVGYAADVCCQRVMQAASALGYEVVVTPDPLAAPFSLTWRICTDSAEDATRWKDASGPRAVAGVLVRASGGPVSADGWTPKDLNYIRTESQAALVAWLWSLACPVINRPRPDIWFRPYRPYPEWHELFARCDLPVLPVCVTNDLETARAFSATWRGVATYGPLTSSSRYPIAGPRDWLDLAKVLAHVPVCLMQPDLGRSIYATVVGGLVVWNEDTPQEVTALESRLLRLAGVLGLDFVQVEIAVSPESPRCIKADPYPVLGHHDAAAQSAITARLVDLLCRDGQARGPVQPPEALHLGGRAGH